MRILKLFILLLACATSGQVLAQQPWSSTGSSSQALLAWNGGGHGGWHHHNHFSGHRHGFYRPYYRPYSYYPIHPRVIIAPSYYGGYVVGPQPYYYPRYGSPRVVIQYYDPRLGIFVGTDLGGY
ncbi:hypothetical protein ACFW0H_05555 [Pseudomonas sp. CR3202]|uniref:hypothetical protein n=1 Tax=Pseudomonas sp. CR3202 TaxID=3351532 RepID=UPI003BEF8731